MCRCFSFKFAKALIQKYKKNAVLQQIKPKGIKRQKREKGDN